LVELWIPYGDVEVSVRVSEENLAWLADPIRAGKRDVSEAIRTALSSPLGSQALGDLVRPGLGVAIAVDGLRGHFPMANALLPLMDELYAAGATAGDIDVIVATGNHPVSKIDELSAALKVGEVMVNDQRGSDFVDVGTTSFGTKVQINRAFNEAGLKIAVSALSVDWLYGFRGGPSCIVPGMCSASTALQNSRLALQKEAKIGPACLEGNPVHLSSKESAAMAGVQLSLIVLPDRDGNIHAAYYGAPDAVFERSVGMASKLYLHGAQEEVDILVVGAGGEPHDSSLIEACDAVFNAEGILGEEGRAVIVAECKEGPGDSNFFNFLSRIKDPRAAMGEVRGDFSLEAYKALKFLKLREGHGISLVSAMPVHFAEKMHLRTADTANEGLQNAFRFLGRGSRIGVVVDGSSVAPCLVGGTMQAFKTRN